MSCDCPNSIRLRRPVCDGVVRASAVWRLGGSSLGRKQVVLESGVHDEIAYYGLPADGRLSKFGPTPAAAQTDRVWASPAWRLRGCSLEEMEPKTDRIFSMSLSRGSV